ncbi:hypothetical protein WJX81_006659 [Elliptochloris bilobata]|uniref:Uncharacterized protein n=1 Tax=Elliptochloris bilobata TaxID=381761 RepID=A0AAW1S7Q1_9CHLO
MPRQPWPPCGARRACAPALMQARRPTQRASRRAKRQAEDVADAGNSQRPATRARGGAERPTASTGTSRPRRWVGLAEGLADSRPAGAADSGFAGGAGGFGRGSGHGAVAVGGLPRHSPRSSDGVIPSDSLVGAIVEDGGGGGEEDEEVQESAMFQHCFSGHRNMSSSAQVALMGPRSEFVVSGSDDGRVFIWERGSGQLVNLLAANEGAAAVVAPNPMLPMLATAGNDTVVRLWAPTAERPAALADAEQVMRRNAAELAEGAAPAPGPPLWLNMLGPAALAAAELHPRHPRARAGGRAGHQPHVRCSIM